MTKLNCEVIARNARTPFGEIDIVSRRGDVTIFVGVKTRTSDKMGLPEESITARKRLRMISAPEHYAMEHAIDHWQVDIIAVEGKPGSQPKFTHFENVIE